VHSVELVLVFLNSFEKLILVCYNVKVFWIFHNHVNFAKMERSDDIQVIRAFSSIQWYKSINDRVPLNHSLGLY